MSDVAGIVLHSILKDPENVLDIWAKLKLQYFSASYTDIFVAISQYYNKFSALPSFKSLELVTRNQILSKKIKALALLEVDEDIDLNIAIEALIDQYTQEEILDSLSTYVDKITSYDSSNAILNLSDIVLKVEESVDHSEEDFLMNDLLLMNEEELKTKIPFTLNNTLDANTGGIELTNLVMIGGYRGSGKTIAGCNIACNHFNRDSVTMFFTIEMRAREINWRIMSILSGVSNKNIKNQTLTKEELSTIAKVRSDFFVDSEEVYQDYLLDGDYLNFEKRLCSSKRLNPNKQIIIIDNPRLTLADIDSKIQKYKNKHGDKLQSVVVDSVNKLVTVDKYDWKHQVENGDKLKDFAAKHNLLMVGSYQTDKEGEARFAKGILDSGDYAINLKNMNTHLNFKSTKTRGTSSFEFNSPIDWDSLKISSNDYVESKDTSEEGVRDFDGS